MDPMALDMSSRPQGMYNAGDAVVDRGNSNSKDYVIREGYSNRACLLSHYLVCIMRLRFDNAEVCVTRIIEIEKSSEVTKSLLRVQFFK
jgi:hypothetical protein